MPRLLDVGELADLLHLSKSTVYGKIASKEIPHLRIGGRRLFSVEDIEAWLRGQKVAPASQHVPQMARAVAAGA